MKTRVIWFNELECWAICYHPLRILNRTFNCRTIDFRTNCTTQLSKVSLVLLFVLARRLVSLDRGTKTHLILRPLLILSSMFSLSLSVSLSHLIFFDSDSSCNKYVVFSNTHPRAIRCGVHY